MSLTDRLRFAARLSRRRHYPEIVAYLCSGLAALLGLSLLVNPEGYAGNPIYDEALIFASAGAWGVVFTLGGTLLAAAVTWARTVAMWPAGGLSALWGIWAAFMFSEASQGGAPAAAVGYTVASWITLGLVGVYWTDTEAVDATP